MITKNSIKFLQHVIFAFFCFKKIIKGSCPAILTTETEINKLNEMETTNTILLISHKDDQKNKVILMKTSFLVDAMESVPEENMQTN